MKMNTLRFVGASTVELPLAGVDASGPFMLKSVDGLGPPDISVRLGRLNTDRASYQGKSAGLRQVIALVGLQPDWDSGQTPEELRQALYTLLTPRNSAMVKLEIVHDGVVQGFTQGQISKIEPSLFTQDPAVVVTLSCDYPYILAQNDVVQTPEIGVYGLLHTLAIENDGNAPAGFKMGLVINEELTPDRWLLLTDGDPLGQKFTVAGVTWHVGDRFIIDTRQGSRGVWRKPSGSNNLNNILGKVLGGSEWLQLYAGDNNILVSADVSFDPAYNFVHQPAFWGV